VRRRSPASNPATSLCWYACSPCPSPFPLPLYWCLHTHVPFVICADCNGCGCARSRHSLSRSRRSRFGTSSPPPAACYSHSTYIDVSSIQIPFFSHSISHLPYHNQPPRDVETYVHRSGRTGRAGKLGKCLVLYHSTTERAFMASLSEEIGAKITPFYLKPSDSNKSRAVSKVCVVCE
jgi:hypothetical protein